MKRVMFLFLFLAGMHTANAACAGIHDFRFTTLQGSELDLCNYQDVPILVVNTASKCGFTPQFAKLEEMYEKYRGRGLLIVGFPSNDFKQEFSTNEEIGDFCVRNYGVQFPMIEKSSVVGPQANVLYKQLIETTHEPPMWNFYKYLVLPDDKIYAFNNDTAPESPDILRRMEPYLK
jgi:glutathione peroxidase